MTLGVRYIYCPNHVFEASIRYCFLCKAVLISNTNSPTSVLWNFMRKFIYITFILCSLFRERKKPSLSLLILVRTMSGLSYSFCVWTSRGLGGKKDPKFTLFINSKADPKTYFQLINYFCWNILCRWLCILFSCVHVFTTRVEAPFNLRTVSVSCVCLCSPGLHT